MRGIVSEGLWLYKHEPRLLSLCNFLLQDGTISRTMTKVPAEIINLEVGFVPLLD